MIIDGGLQLLRWGGEVVSEISVDIKIVSVGENRLMKVFVNWTSKDINNSLLII